MNLKKALFLYSEILQLLLSLYQKSWFVQGLQGNYICRSNHKVISNNMLLNTLRQSMDSENSKNVTIRNGYHFYIKSQGLPTVSYLGNLDKNSTIFYFCLILRPIVQFVRFFTKNQINQDHLIPSRPWLIGSGHNI